MHILVLVLLLVPVLLPLPFLLLLLVSLLPLLLLHLLLVCINLLSDPHCLSHALARPLSLVLQCFTLPCWPKDGHHVLHWKCVACTVQPGCPHSIGTATWVYPVTCIPM